MKKNTEAIILKEGAADLGRVSAVLRAWGYEESEIRHFLSQRAADHTLHERSEENDPSKHPMRLIDPD